MRVAEGALVVAGSLRNADVPALFARAPTDELDRPAKASVACVDTTVVPERGSRSWVSPTTSATPITPAPISDERPSDGPGTAFDSPSSDGCRHVRSWGGRGAGVYPPSSSSHSLPLTAGQVSEPGGARGFAPGALPRRPLKGPAGIAATMAGVPRPDVGETWIALTTEELSVGAVYDWAVRADCGAVVLFSGTVRDHAEGRTGVEHLTYEAYEEQAVPRMQAIADEIRVRWAETGRIALLHRVGRMTVTESTVLVVVSSPHRPEAFEAARFGIDALKASVPIWKHEVWDGGSDWGTGAHEVVAPQNVASA